MESLVQGTNDSSILSKYSMVCRGYFDDNVIKHFVSKEARRSPLIHLGYFVRSLIMDYSIRQYMDHTIKKSNHIQVLSLGAGFDTTFFRLTSSYPQMLYFEVDLHDVVVNKIAAIKKSLPDNLQQLNESVANADFIHLKSDKYSIFSHDLNDLDGFERKLTLLGLNFELPTLIFSECAVTYMKEERSTNLIKWSAQMFPLSTFMNYEQINPDDGFGQVMMAHFNKIQNPLRSLSKYKTRQDQTRRYKECGWSHCDVFLAMDLFVSILPPNGFVDVFKIEPFDEWEELHLKCQHYTLAVASHMLSFLPFKTNEESQNEEVTKGSLVPVCLTSLPLERYAHSNIVLNDGSTMIIGGFGVLADQRHGRIKELTHVGDSLKRICVSSTLIDVTWDCLYHTCTSLGNDSFLLFGGRTSPVKEVNSHPILLKVVNKGDNIDVTADEINLSTDVTPAPRWRHSAISYNNSYGRKSILIFGGRNAKLEVFGDLWELDLSEDNSRWIERTSKNHNTPNERFSQSMTSGNDIIYMSGGIGKGFMSLGDIWQLELNGEETTWTQLKPKSRIPFIYGHTSHWHQGKLIIVGGITTCTINQPQITMLDLASLQPYFYDIKTSNPTLMLHNHTSIFKKDEDVIYIYGGGGNCFSFGTHFNKYVLSIPLRTVNRKTLD